MKNDQKQSSTNSIDSVDSIELNLEKFNFEDCMVEPFPQLA